MSSTEIEFDQVLVTPIKFERILQESRIKLRNNSDTLIKEIRERFHRDDFLEIMAMVNLSFWNLISNYNNTS